MPIESPVASRETFTVLGLRIDNLTREEAIGQIMNLAAGEGTHHVCFVNAHCANVACVDPDYRRLLRGADLALPDGIGVKLAARWSGEQMKDNVNGTDLFPLLCGALQATNRSIFLLGGRPGVVDGVKRWIGEQFPTLRVAGTQHGYFSAAEEDMVLRRIGHANADFLLVAMGVPTQEKWIDRNLSRLGVKVAMGVGGLFDFYSQNIPRAPLWMRDHGLEWAYRLYQEPGRMWRRYVVGNPLFLARVLRQPNRARR